MPKAALLLMVIAALAIGCKKERTSKRLPAASDWQAPPMTSSGAAKPVAPTTGSDPHAGMNMGAGGDPHAGMNMGAGGDPHAGMNMGAGGDPHAGMNMGAGGDPHAAADPMATMQAPDPNRPIDDSQFLKGSITTNAETAGLVKAGALMFISVKPIEPVTGEPVGGIIAVDRIDVTTLPATFHLSERNAMSAGTRFSGDVIIYARVDADGEARTRSPGDVEGSIRAKIPAEDLELVLDTVLR